MSFTLQSLVITYFYIIAQPLDILQTVFDPHVLLSVNMSPASTAGVMEVKKLLFLSWFMCLKS